MAGNFFNNSLNTNLNKPFGFNFLPERTMKQVRESAVNLLKDVVKPLTDIGQGQEKILDGTIPHQIETYKRLINTVNMNMTSIDTNTFRSLDFKS